jgi:predicted membrane protein DUF2207
VVGVIASSLSDSFSVPVLTAGAVAAVCWVVAAVLIGLARRPPRIRAAEQTMELPPESPAVAGLLVNDFVVPAEVAPAILLDLAARRVVTLDEVQPGRTICRLRPRSETEGLRPYERRVLESLQKKAIDGVVPTEALTTGPETESKSWHRDLVREVVDEAQSSGLTHDRWPKLMIGALSTLLGIAIVLGAISIKDESSTPPEEVPVTFFVVLGVAACFIALASYVTARMGRSQAQLPTEAGRAETAACEGLAHHLRDDRPLADLPPAAVALRGRHFAYAAAFGFAPLAVELLPMGKEDDRRAWSRFGGRWRRVRVRYPRFWPPAWGPRRVGHCGVLADHPRLGRDRRHRATRRYVPDRLALGGAWRAPRDDSVRARHRLAWDRSSPRGARSLVVAHDHRRHLAGAQVRSRIDERHPEVPALHRGRRRHR